MAAVGAALWTVSTTISNSERCLGPAGPYTGLIIYSPSAVMSPHQLLRYRSDQSLPVL